jgi:hypothetical protein
MRGSGKPFRALASSQCETGKGRIEAPAAMADRARVV